MAENIYTKLQSIRVDLQGMNIKKSGENKFAGYKYYELGDFLPVINRLCLAKKVATLVTFESEYAKLKIINCEAPEEVIEFTSPMAGATLKGAHDIQNLGAVETYQRRYLYMAAFEIVESDFFDATQGMNQPKQENKQGKKLSEYMSKQLNDAVQGYATLTSTSIKMVLEEINSATGKTPAQMNDSDGEKVLELIRNWSDKYVESLGA